VEAGTFVKKGEKIRAKAGKGEEDKKELTHKDEMVVEEKAQLTVLKKLLKEPIPEVEWWDKVILNSDTYDVDKIKMEEITIYVEHPIPVKPPPEVGKDVLVLPMYLTKKEQKKLRRQTRLEREKDRREQQALGLVPVPKPKVKISNLPRVLGTEATADPTAIEAEVKRQVAERQAEHEARNNARKLTKEEKKEKKKKKLEDDVKKGTCVALFRVNDLTNPKHKYKVDVNAKQLGLGGCVITFGGITMVLVEGGAAATRRFTKLMTRRIKWNPEQEEDAADGKEKEAASNKPENKAVLVWQGTQLRPNFNNQFRFESLQSEDAIRKYLNHRWAEHYWEMCKTYKEDPGITVEII
jgi:U4/U6 small nuclear ribonucleoprotein PRP3